MISAEHVFGLQEEVSRLSSRLRGGIRNLLSQSELIAGLAYDSALSKLASSLLNTNAFPVRALLFDKVAEANWKVAWHQDTAIAVAARVNLPGYTGWSEKDGVPHVHPPAETLESMVSLRLHLDDCGTDNGPLRVIPSSHQSGVLDSAQIDLLRANHDEVTCCAQAGDVLAMRPLLLHASSAANRPSHRRVIHIEYACQPLPHGLQWHEQAKHVANLN